MANKNPTITVSVVTAPLGRWYAEFDGSRIYADLGEAIKVPPGSRFDGRVGCELFDTLPIVDVR